jgi:ABC-type transport system involved in cytochrome c biogenesis permease subunit
VWAPTKTAASAVDLSAIETLPILEGGRLKPLDTFATTLIQTLSHEKTVAPLRPIEYLAELLFTPKQSYQRSLFSIDNPEILTLLNLTKNKNKRYSFSEIVPGLEKNIALLNTLEKQSPEHLSLTQKQFLSLYQNMLWYFDISRSFSLFFDDFVIDDPQIASALQQPIHTPISYLDLLPYKSIVAQHVQPLLQKNKKSRPLSQHSHHWLALAKQMQARSQDRLNSALKIIHTDPADPNHWETPWQSIDALTAFEHSADLEHDFQSLNILINSYKTHNNTLFQSTARPFSAPYFSKLHLEVLYHHTDFFSKSLFCYVITLLCTLCLIIKNRCALQQDRAFYYLKLCALSSFIVGILFASTGILIRILLLSRPPVATLYESILFVGWISALLGLAIEYTQQDAHAQHPNPNRRQNSLGLLLGAGTAGLLQWIANDYALEGDTLHVLLAVLNTNFWLGTHVIAITIGYGTCLLAGTLSHIALMYYLIDPKSLFVLEEQKILKSIQIVGLLALFFSSLGTVLGGIWADQSWGRFWGWDPKENGALLIVLWLTTLFHANIAKLVHPLFFIAGMALTNVVVILAWFGVNLLSVGLHSYGFTDKLQDTLHWVIAGQIILVIALTARGYWICHRKKLLI